MASPPLSPRIHNSDINSSRNPKRYKHDRKESEEEKVAMCLVMLAHSAYDTATTATAATEPKQINYHKCNICGKAFSSHQALGGHKASHREKPPTVKDVAVEENKALNYVSALNSRGRIHECSVCHKIFPTGQALGGHKRKHYEGVIGGAKSNAMRRVGSSGVSSTASSSHKESPRHVLEFDLNMSALSELELES